MGLLFSFAAKTDFFHSMSQDLRQPACVVVSS